jgi:cytoskeletal protein CcmA (bactofilin family)
MSAWMNGVRMLSLGLMLGFPYATFAMTDAGETVTKSGTVSDDYYAAGGTVDIDADIAGDLVVSGGDLLIGRRVQADVMAAGGTIDLHGEVADDVRIAGGEITIDATIGDDLLVAGGKVKVSSGTSVGGEAWLAGGDVLMAGTVNHDVFIGAGKIEIAGTIHGDVTLEGGEIDVLKGALIEGDLHYTSPHEANIDPDAKITGNIDYKQSKWEHHHRGYGIVFSITMLIAGIVMFLLFPGYTISAARRISTEPWKSLGIGFMLLIVTPIAAVILMMIVVGVWVGLSILALYFIALLLGFLTSCFFLGDWGARLLHKDVSTTGLRLITLAIAIILLGFIQLIPVLGGLLIFFLLLFGLGAAMLQVYSVYSQPSPGS